MTHGARKLGAIAAIGDAANAQCDVPAYRVQYRQVRNPWYLRVLFMLWVVCVPPYVVIRLGVVNWHSWLGPVALALDAVALLLLVMFNFLARRLYVPVHRTVELSRFVVDALIPTHMEQVSLIEPTIIAAKRVRGLRHVVVVANFERAEVRELCDRHGVRYFARGTNEYAKAGNLNNALKHTDADFIMIVDADHMARPDLLERLMGYFDDPRIAYAQAPQTYYNTESFLFRPQHGKEAGWTELQGFYHCMQLAKNGHEAPIMVGCTAVLRRAALDQVGGFAQGTPTEDIHTSLRLQALGWKGVFTPEPLAFGLEAANQKEYHSQRNRWAAGTLNLLFLSPDSPLRVRRMKLGVRLHFLYGICIHLGGIMRLSSVLLPLLVLFTLQNPVSIPYWYYGPFFTTWMVITLTLAYLHSRGATHPLYGDAYAFGSAFATATGARGLFIPTRHFASSRKLTTRVESHWSKWALWALVGLTALALARGWYAAATGGLSPLIAWSSAFAVFNSFYLLSYLVILTRYETHPPVAEHARHEGEDKYRYVMDRFDAGEIGTPEALLNRPLSPTAAAVPARPRLLTPAKR